jgi:hypothetical protein
MNNMAQGICIEHTECGLQWENGLTILLAARNRIFSELRVIEVTNGISVVMEPCSHNRYKKCPLKLSASQIKAK